MRIGMLERVLFVLAFIWAVDADTKVTVGPSRHLNPMLLGLNDVLGPIVNLSYTDASLVAAARTLRVGTLRHPGGTVANYWSLVDGRYVEGCTPGAPPHVPDEPSGRRLCGCCEFADGVASRPVGTFSPIAFCEKNAVGGSTSAPTVFDINVLTLNSSESVAQLQYLKDANLTVEYIELGNEFYIAKDYAWRFPTPASYVKACVPVIAAAREMFPNAKVAVVGSHNSLEWNSGVAEELRSTIGIDGVDAVTIHMYSPMAQDAPTHIEHSFVLAFPDAALQNLSEAVASIYSPSTRIWMTEFNYGIQKPPLPSLTDGAVHGMFWAAHVLAAVNDVNDAYNVMMMHAFTSQDGVGWDSRTGLVRVPASGSYGPSSARVNGVAQIFAHISTLAQEGGKMHPVKVEGGADVPVVQTTKPLPCVQAAVFSGEVAPFWYLVAINRCDRVIHIEIDISGTTLKPPTNFSTVAYSSFDAGGWTTLPPESTPLPWDGPLTPTSTTVEPVTPKFELAALTLTVFTFQ